MANNSEHDNSDSSSEFTDDAIYRFLLGQLSAAEQLTFEGRLFDDEKLERRVHLAEYELTDNYVFERLRLPDRRLFEQNFLLSFDRKQKLIVSKALHKRFAPVLSAVSFEEKTTLGERLVGLFNFTQPRRFVFGVVTLLLSIGTLWLAIKAPRIREKFIAQRPPVVRPSPSTSLRASHHASPTLNHHETSSPMIPPEPPESPAKAEPAVTIVLSPASSFESRQSPLINLPSSEQDIVRLALRVKPSQAGTLRADLLTSDGKYVFSGESLKAIADDGSKAYLDVSAGLLKSGEYRINLSLEEGSGGNVGTYYFRVQ